MIHSTRPPRGDATSRVETDPQPGSGSPRVSLLLYHRHGTHVEPLAAARPLVVGRSEPSDVQIADGSLSRRHARFEWRDGALSVEDLGSTNGTWRGGQRIAGTVELRPGDQVKLGAVIASLHVLAPSDEQPSELDGHDEFIRRLQQELVRSRTLGTPTALLMVQASDRADAAHVSRWYPRVCRLLRPIDRAAGYGPHELLAYLAAAGDEQARALAETALGGQQEIALRCGIACYPAHGSTADQLLTGVRRALRQTTAQTPVCSASPRQRVRRSRDDAPLVISPQMREVYETLDRVAATSVPVLILGETGTGKGVVADAIQQRSGRSRPLLAVNCGAIPEQLLESALFGHERGAFTGADQRKKGVFEEADGGAVLLDEIGELSPSAQAALLRVLESGSLRRVGASQEISVDVRIIAATHRDLEAMCRAGTFRWDLLYRLNTVTLVLPPLRERKQEILPLSEQFLREAAAVNGRDVQTIDPAARELLRAHDWPGNVRELRNVIDRAVVIAVADAITADDLPVRLRRPAGEGRSPSVTASHEQDNAEGLSFKQRMRRYEAKLLREALAANDWNQTRTARALEMPLRTLVRKINHLGLKKPPGVEPD